MWRFLLPEGFVGGGPQFSENVKRYHEMVKELKFQNKVFLLMVTFTSWLECGPWMISKEWFRSKFDADDFYESLDIDQLPAYHLNNSSFYYMMLLVDVFEYKMFKRVPKLLDILARGNHPLAKYSNALFMMLDPDRDVALEGLNIYRDLVMVSSSLWYIKYWRQNVSSDAYKICPGIFENHFGHGKKFCGRHQKMEDETEELCVECLADHEVKCFNNHFYFQASVVGF